MCSKLGLGLAIKLTASAASEKSSFPYLNLYICLKRKYTYGSFC